MHCAVSQGSPETIICLCKAGASRTIRDERGHLALTPGAERDERMKECIEIIETLESLYNPTASAQQIAQEEMPNRLWMLLLRSVENGFVELVGLLLQDARIDVNKKFELTGNSVLHTAAYRPLPANIEGYFINDIYYRAMPTNGGNAFKIATPCM